MRGTVLIFDPSRGHPAVHIIEGPPTLEFLKTAIGGGYIEPVPYWHSIIHDGERCRCVAFCDEEGKLKQLPLNEYATAIWDRNMRRDYGHGCSPDYLVGQIAVLIGDEDFLAEL